MLQFSVFYPEDDADFDATLSDWISKLRFEKAASLFMIVRAVLYHCLTVLLFELFDSNSRKNSYAGTWGLEQWKIMGHVPLILATITGHNTEQDMSIPITCFDGNCKKKNWFAVALCLDNMLYF